MDKNIGAIVFLAVAAFLVVGLIVTGEACAPITPAPYYYEGEVDDGVSSLSSCVPVLGVENAGTLYRCHDEEADVLCWLYLGYRSAGVSCLPKWQTGLREWLNAE